MGRRGGEERWGGEVGGGEVGRRGGEERWGGKGTYLESTNNSQTFHM